MTTNLNRKTVTTKRRGSTKKRVLLIGAALIGVAIISQGISLLHSVFGGETVNTLGKVNFNQAVPLPPLADSTVSADGTRTFSLDLQTGQTNFLSGIPTNTWGINGAYLGPTLRAARGEKVQIKIKNDLPEATSIHWHGMHLPAIDDGGPHQPIAKGATWSPSWTVNQPAATLWYHPHPHGATETHTYRGVAGMFIIDDPSTDSANLPHTYGIDDQPVIVQDKKFDARNQLVGGASGDGGPTGTLGDKIMVNGAITPYLAITTQRVRLRLLNASTARIYNFGLADNRPMQQVASDSGLLEHPVSKTRVQLSPGERAEVIVEMRAGETVNLQSYPFEFKTGFISGDLIGANDSFDIMQLRAAPSLAASPEPSANLASVEHLAPADAVTTRQFVLDSDTTINNKSMDLNRIDFAVTRGTTEIWNIANHDGLPHSFHIHDVHYQIISIDGAPPPPELAGWKDTMLLQPGQTNAIIMKFADYADAAHPYMYHCHLMRHEDAGMMGQFVVVKPGQKAAPQTDMSHMHM
jgi:FtsP/CotA-like multicopper oxidase with cupredoxin domain